MSTSIRNEYTTDVNSNTRLLRLATSSFIAVRSHIEYDNAGDTKTTNKIAVDLRLIIATLGLISRNTITPPSTLVEMDNFAISGSVGEVGVDVVMIHYNIENVDGRRWQMTTGQDDTYSFKLYVDIPVTGCAS